MAAHVILYVTVPDEDTAKAVGRALLENREAACVNILPGMRSMYWWEDAIEETQEVVLVIKTCRHVMEAARQRIVAMHPYAVPCVIGWDMQYGHLPFMEWLEDQCDAAHQR